MPPHHETHHQIDIQQHLAGSNVVMCGYIQTTICPVCQPGNPELCGNPQTNGHDVHDDAPTDVNTQAPLGLVLQDGKLRHGENEELMEYRHLIAHHTTRTTWMHSYGNEIGRLAQGMPDRNTGTNTIIFIKKNQVPQDRAKDVTYGLITCLVQPEK